MNEEQKNILLKTAKDSVAASVSDLSPTFPVSDDPALNAMCGCFVTLKNAGILRGCIGQFTSDKPLIELIRDMAVAASTRDARFYFDQITPAEIDDLEIEISILSELKETDNPLSLRLGIDGIYIVNGPSSGCFLPQVATEAGWTEQQFLSHCCAHKAQLDPEAWKDDNTTVYLFTAEIFSAKVENL